VDFGLFCRIYAVMKHSLLEEQEKMNRRFQLHSSSSVFVLPPAPVYLYVYDNLVEIKIPKKFDVGERGIIEIRQHSYRDMPKVFGYCNFLLYISYKTTIFQNIIPKSILVRFWWYFYQQKREHYKTTFFKNIIPKSTLVRFWWFFLPTKAE
jgi:hypothetical protein